jgi:endonuclease/exonuclease/phosphatase family metal-dependent hydrolase
MPFYNGIDEVMGFDSEAGQRTLRKLIRLKDYLDNTDNVPPKTLDETLLIASWNIREFDSGKYGDRVPEALYYIAEIISRFDLVAVQEIYKDLKALREVMDILGSHWDYIVTDTTEGAKGNKERLAFLYDNRKVRFGGLAGELVLPDVKVEGTSTPVEQVARTPMVCGFTSGWVRFVMATVHILYGSDAAEDPRRVKEIQEVAKMLRKRTDDPTSWSQNLILLGDFNVYRPQDETLQALIQAGFRIPEEIQDLKSNAPRTKHYDQIALRGSRRKFETTGRAGVIPFFDFVFTEDDEPDYASLMPDGYATKNDGSARDAAGRRTYYRQWRTFQMSDHLPLWIEIRTDFSRDYLSHRVVG